VTCQTRNIKEEKNNHRAEQGEKNGKFEQGIKKQKKKNPQKKKKADKEKGGTIEEGKEGPGGGLGDGECGM